MSDPAQRYRLASEVSPAWPASEVGHVAKLAIDDAVRLAVDVRSVDPRAVFGELTLRQQENPARVVALAVALAAMVDTDRPVSELLAWTDELEQGVA